MNYYQHQMNPIAFSLGPYAFPWYWLVYFCGHFWLIYWLGREQREKNISLGKVSLSLFMLGASTSMIVGGRVFYVLFYNYSYYRLNLAKIGALWEGGMSFHGAFLAVSIYLFLAKWQKKWTREKFLKLLDAVCLGVTPLLFLGRLANFVNGELAGRETDVPWAVVFHRLYGPSPRHPSQIYEAIGEGLLLGTLLWGLRKKGSTSGLMTTCFIGGYGLVRFGLEFFRHPDEQLGLFFNLFSIGQIYSLSMVALGIGAFYFLRKREA